MSIAKTPPLDQHVGLAVLTEVELAERVEAYSRQLGRIEASRVYLVQEETTLLRLLAQLKAEIDWRRGVEDCD